MKKMAKVLGLVLALVLLVSVAMADNGKLEEVLSRGQLIVGTGNTNAPWHFYDDEGKLAGFDVSMAKILAKSDRKSVV